MQKVKVARYVAGKRPKYAPSSDNEEEMSEQSDDQEEEEKNHQSTSRRANLPDPNLINKNTGIYLQILSKTTRVNFSNIKENNLF